MGGWGLNLLNPLNMVTPLAHKQSKSYGYHKDVTQTDKRNKQ